MRGWGEGIAGAGVKGRTGVAVPGRVGWGREGGQRVKAEMAWGEVRASHSGKSICRNERAVTSYAVKAERLSSCAIKHAPLCSDAERCARKLACALSVCARVCLHECRVLEVLAYLLDVTSVCLGNC